jgi:hypothetical protein
MNDIYRSDFGPIEWSRIPEQYQTARDDSAVHDKLIRYIWEAVSRNDQKRLKELGLDL